MFGALRIFRKMISTVLVIGIISAPLLLCGCEKDEPEIVTERTVTVEKQVVEEKTVVE